MLLRLDRATLGSVMPRAFIICFIASALLAQASSDIEPWKERAPIEYFTGGLLWMLGVLFLLTAVSPSRAKGTAMFWLVGCVVVSILAIDEAMAGHEWVEYNWRLNDDYLKMVLLLITVWVLYAVFRYVGPNKQIKFLFVVGLVFQCLYIMFEISDGELYDASFILAVETAKWGEELCELFFLAAYWLGFFRIYQSIARSPSEDAVRDLPALSADPEG